MFDEPTLIVAVLAALAFAVVLIVFAISIRFINSTMQRRRWRRFRTRFVRERAGRDRIEPDEPAENRPDHEEHEGVKHS